MFGKRTIKNIFSLVIKSLVKFVAKYNLTLFRVIANSFFLLFFLLERIRGRNSSRVSTGYDSKNQSLFIYDHELQKKIFYSVPSRVLGFKKGLKVKCNKIFNHYNLGAITFNDNDTVVDVGANIGEINYSLEKLNLDINYVGIEPSNTEYNALSLNYPESELHNVGCWDQNTELEFYISSESADSSFIYPSARVEAKEMKKVTRLDSLITRKIKLLKIDAEGGEYNVLNGCAGIFHLISYISVDVDFEKGVDKESTIAEVTNLLTENNFELVALARQRLIILFRNKNIIT